MKEWIKKRWETIKRLLRITDKSGSFIFIGESKLSDYE